MIKITLKLLAGAWLALTLAFVALRVLPGDAITAQMTEAGFGAAVIAERRAQAGLDDPLVAQYGRYLVDLMHGEWGYSLYTGEAVLPAIAARAGSTIALALAGIALMILLSILLALLSARRGVLGRMGQALIVVALALPVYVTGTTVIFIGGLAAPDSAHGLLGAGLVLGLHTGAVIAQALAESYRQIARQPYIMAAAGRGLPARRLALRHILPNALLPVLPLIGTQAGFLLSGTVVTEVVFTRAGLGRLMLDAVQRRDIPIVQGLVVLMAIAYGLCLLVTQALYHAIDRRPAR